jgi:hypothetical protein
MSLEIEADYYNTQINTIKTNFFTTLGGYKQIYINYYTTLASNDASTDAITAATTAYDACVLQLQSNILSLQERTTKIQSDIDTLNNKVTMTTTQLGSEKMLNNNNSNIFTDIQTTNSGSNIMISDYKTAYNNQYYNNIELFMGIILIIGVSSKIFRK